MVERRRYITVIALVLVLSVYELAAQLSPGDLSNPHAHLEGLSNCTQCHVLGNRVANEKCLACHSEIQQRITAKKGYHYSSEVKDKTCFSCHSEHNGKNFKIVRLDVTNFDHNLTGYQLSVPHAKEDCRSCHTTAHIADPKIKAKKNTYLGLNAECLSCHEDYHQQTLSSVCLNCHTPEAFKPATKFNHSTARFKLAGKHQSVDCIECHKVETINGKKFQEFRGLQFANCTNCHDDPHKNQFGQNCRQCHTENSFQTILGVNTFDHSKTDFMLEGKHQAVDCKVCHKTKLTDPLKHDRCTDCHTDYHMGQFTRNGVSPDCSQCHSVKGFTQFSYSIDQHNLGVFPLNGSHGAVPCLDCHKKQEKWSFRNIGLVCKDCHTDVHSTLIQPKYYPGADCRVCHNEERWADVTFDHSTTGFGLTGAHIDKECRLCHFKTDAVGLTHQKFQGLSTNCSECHTDNHYRQFEKNGITDCTRCHSTKDWTASAFNHDNTAFKLDGKHVNVACVKCHKVEKEGSVSYIKYKLKEFKCESCH